MAGERCRQEENMERSCPIHKTMDFIGKRWTLMILLELHRGSAKWKRYSVVKRGLKGITPKILSMRMKELVKEEMVRKRVDAKTFPVKSEYSLTERGEDFVRIIREIKSWGLKWKVKNEVCKTVECQQCEF
jgi:DNA-binding HxlR family transcriptional regulator